MEEDLVPNLLQAINQQFDEKTKNSPKIKAAIKALRAKEATYLNANDFAIEAGRLLSEVLGTNLSASILPDGKMYFNIADRVLNSTLKKNHDLIAGYSKDVQTLLNDQAGIHLKVQEPEFNQDKVDGIINRVSSEDDFDKIKWVLDDPIVNFSQSVVDDSIDANAKFQAKSGLHPTITRKLMGKGCDWCRNLAGTYEYYEAPHDIYRRHERCRCTVEYNPGSGKRQDVWSKKWSDPEQTAKLAERIDKGTGKRPVSPNRKKQFRQASQKMLAENKRFIKKLPKEQYDAIKTYTGESYKTVNRHFRTGSKLGQKLLGIPDDLDQALNHEIGQDVKVFRGLSKLPDNWSVAMDDAAGKRLRAVAGKIKRKTLKPSQVGDLNAALAQLGEFQVEDPAYMSTTYAQRVAKEFSSNIRMELNVPREAHGLAVESASNYASESEILLARGAKIKISGIQISDDAKTLILKGEVLNE